MNTNSLIAALVIAGCASGPRVTPQQAAAVRKVGILSMTMDALGPAPSDLEVQAQALQVAHDSLGRRLMLGGRFEVADLRGAGEPVTSFSWPTRSRAYASGVQGMDSGMSQAEAAMMAALTGGSRDLSSLALDMLEKEQEAARARLVAVSGLAAVPLAAVTAQTGTTTITFTNGQRQRSPEENKRELVYRAAGALATELGVDALLIVYFPARLAATGTRVFLGDRGLDTVKMAVGYVLVNREGQPLVDVAPPVLDDLAPSRLAVPVYRKVGSDRQVDLAEPRVRDTLVELTDSLVDPVVERLTRDLSPARGE